MITRILLPVVDLIEEIHFVLNYKYVGYILLIVLLLSPFSCFFVCCFNIMSSFGI